MEQPDSVALAKTDPEYAGKMRKLQNTVASLTFEVSQRCSCMQAGAHRQPLEFLAATPAASGHKLLLSCRALHASQGPMLHKADLLLLCWQAGIIFHSIFIGVSLGVSTNANTVTALMIALFFHQARPLH